MCEPVCPSRNTTTTPRQRILLRREMARQAEGSPVLAASLAEYEHDSIETCAADGSCGPACPLAIDTRKSALPRAPSAPRDPSVSPSGPRASGLASRRRPAAGWVAARPSAIRPWTGRRRQPAGSPAPSWCPGGPRACRRWRPARCRPRKGGRRRGVPARLHQPDLGNPLGADAHPTLPEALSHVSRRAGVPPWIPYDVAGNCCATPGAEGYQRGHRGDGAAGGRPRCCAGRTADPPGRRGRQLAHQAGWRGHGPALDDGARGAVGAGCGSSTRSSGRTTGSSSSLRSRPRSAVAVHPTCSASQLGLGRKLVGVARALADDVVVPAGAGCCGWPATAACSTRRCRPPQCATRRPTSWAATPRRLSVLEPDLRDRPPATDRPKPVRVVRVPARAADALGASGAVRGRIRTRFELGSGTRSRRRPDRAHGPPSSRPATASTSSPRHYHLEPVEAQGSAGGAGAPSPTQVFKPRWWWQ